MRRLSVIIPTFNEEENINKVIESVKFANEIIVVDSFSNDKTKEIANKNNIKFLERKYDYSASQKNWAIKKAKYNWILIVDADEIVNNELKNEIVNILSKIDDNYAYWIYRKNYFMNKKIRFSGWQNDKVIRLFNRDFCIYENKIAHAEIICEGKVGYLKNKLLHNTFKNMDHYVNKMIRYAKYQAIDLHKKNIKPNFFKLLFKPQIRFIKHFIIKFGIFDGIVGLIIAILNSYSVFLRYLFLYDFYNNDKQRNK